MQKNNFSGLFCSSLLLRLLPSLNLCPQLPARSSQTVCRYSGREPVLHELP